MSIKYTAECDLCGKREENQYREGMPVGWYQANLYIEGFETIKDFRDTSFLICHVCYPPEFAKQDLQKNNDVIIFQSSPKLKEIFKKILTKLKNACNITK